MIGRLILQALMQQLNSLQSDKEETENTFKKVAIYRQGNLVESHFLL